MESVNLIGVFLIVPIVVVLILIIKRTSQEIAFMLSIMMTVLMLSFTLSVLDEMIRGFNEVITAINVDFKYFEPIIKITGIGIVARIVSEICKNAGESALAAKVELLASIAAALVALPLFTEVLRLIGRFL